MCIRDRPGANDLNITNARAGANHRKELMEQSEDYSGTILKPLSINQKVMVQNPISKSWDEKGIITGIRPNGRSYDVLLNSGKTFLRNRAFLCPIHGSSKHQLPDTKEEPPDALQPPTLRRSACLRKKKAVVTYANRSRRGEL